MSSAAVVDIPLSKVGGASGQPAAVAAVHVEASGIKNWLRFANERIQFPVYVLISLAYSLSGMYINFQNTSADAHPDAAKTPDPRVAHTFFTLLLTLCCVRLMDDLKDYETDIDAHPDRPLPRGLVRVSEARWVVGAMVALLTLNSIILILYNSVVSGVCAIAIVIFITGMFFEFGISEYLSTRPLTYAITHQPVLIIIAAFAVSMTIIPAQSVWNTPATTTLTIQTDAAGNYNIPTLVAHVVDSLPLDSIAVIINNATATAVASSSSLLSSSSSLSAAAAAAAASSSSPSASASILVSAKDQFLLLSFGQTWHFGLLLLGASFSYEVCRKLDPTAHVSLNYYLQFYGPFYTYLMVLIPVGVSAWSSLVLGLGPLLWPFEGLLLLSLFLLLASGNKGKAFKLVELICTINTLFHTLGPAILAWGGWLGMHPIGLGVYKYWFQ